MERIEYVSKTECYNCSCPFRQTLLPTSETRCECYACPNREAFALYYYMSNEVGKETRNGWSNSSERS